MHTLVIYDSQYGNTERVAQAVADTLRGSGTVELVHIDPNRPLELQGVDLLVVGSPTQGWKPTRALQSLLAAIAPGQLDDQAVACFDTRFRKPKWLTGSAASSTARTFQKMGAVLVVPPESFFVEQTAGPLLSDELARAATWAQQLVKATERSHSLQAV